MENIKNNTEHLKMGNMKNNRQNLKMENIWATDNI